MKSDSDLELRKMWVLPFEEGEKNMSDKIEKIPKGICTINPGDAATMAGVDLVSTKTAKF